MKKTTVISAAAVFTFALSLCGCKAEPDRSPQNDVSSIDTTYEISSETSDTVEFTSQNTEISDEHKDAVDIYPPDFYSQTIPPEEKSLECHVFNANPKVFSCAISDNSLTDNEKIEAASKLLAEEYIKEFMSDEYLFRILEYRNVSVDFIEHTVDRRPIDPTQYSISNGIGDMEVSENAWVIDIDAEIKFSGSFGFVSSAELDGENVWNHIPFQGMSRKYLLYMQDDIFYLWSRDVYHYERQNS